MDPFQTPSAANEKMSTSTKPAPTPMFTPGTVNDPIAPPDSADSGTTVGQVGLLTSEADVAGIQKKGI